MYGIRDDKMTGLLYLELSGRVPTAEAARAVSQAFALAEAGQRTRLLCDVREVSLGPDEQGVVAALIAARSSADLRIAFVGNAEQLRQAGKLVQMSGITRQAGVFSQVADAEAWLALTTSSSDRFSAPAKPKHQEVTTPPRRTAAFASRGTAA